MPKVDTPEVAKLLREYAQRTALRGGNPYRSKAYSRAADSLAALPVALDRLNRAWSRDSWINRLAFLDERLATFFDFFPDFLTDFLALFRPRSFRNRLRCGLKRPSTPERA